MKKKLVTLLLCTIATLCLALGLTACGETDNTKSTSNNDGDNIESPVHDHTYGAWVCDGETTHTRECSCGDSQTQNHTFNGDTCSRCNYVKPTGGNGNTDLPAHSHSYILQNTHSTFLKAVATCTEPAVYYYSCSCGEKGTETFTIGSANGHSYTQQNTDSAYLRAEATCTYPAVYYYSCSCGVKGTTTFTNGNAKGHINTKQTEAQDSDCGNVGYTAGEYCDDCQTYISGHTEIPATGLHSYTDGVCTTCSGLQTKELVYTLSEDGESYFVSGAETGATEVYIASIYNNKPVTSISIEGIRKYVFFEYYTLTSITIPSSVTSIAYGAFYKCSKLKNIYYTGDIAGWCSIKGLGYLMNHDYTSDNKTLTIGGNLVEGDIVIPDGVTSIGGGAFYECSGLTSVTIPDDGVTSIGSEAFYGCSGLTSVTIPNGVTSIGSEAFYGCSGLTSITIPDGVMSIGSSAFSGCAALASITIPDSVTDIGNEAFYNTAYYKNKSNWEDDVLYIGKHLIRGNCTFRYVIKDGTLTIASGAFSGCSSLKSVTIPDGVTSIRYGTFSNCYILEFINIPSSVTSIEVFAFYNCNGLTSVTFENPNGWSATSLSDPKRPTTTELSSNDLSNTSTAATYLTSTYCGCNWERSTENE